MKVKFLRNHNGNLEGTTGSLPEKIAKRHIKNGICQPLEEPKKGKGSKVEP